MVAVQEPASLIHHSPPARRRRRGFTLIEVMAGAAVMALAIMTSIVTLQYGMRAIDTARYTTLAGQILQSQMEKLRLLTWTQLTDPTYGPGASANTTFTPDNTLSTPELGHFTTLTQTLTDAPAPFTGTMKDITLTAGWTDSFGRAHSLTYTTRYGKNGISDFFYTTH